ncbi:CHAP domain-containing protein [Tessaracoccus caeni]|uniref:CHAP domain-containing protein n=1 Tax=Tessaracoccus caeni TaxID=3031239 RepID=UPI0023DC4D70|nr:CHAP domain-containing protein [Tessaracoccus caeni]MDF1488511.1 CHAP domain-containing protein [Tessaracoccus caeni]
MSIRRILFSVLAALSLVLSSLVFAPAAQASPAIANRDYGYPYPSAPDCDEVTEANCAADKWSFYQGQCTSWVAYRLNQLNFGAEKTFTNWYAGVHWGNANKWGPAARSAGISVDANPRKGSVAWWDRAFHVAYVEEVYADGSILISEMNADYHNSFRLTTLRNGGRWPDGFIHVKDISGPPPSADSDGDGVPDDRDACPAVPGRVELGGCPVDANGNGIEDSQEMIPWDTDVNGDGFPDVVGFADSGVSVALNTGSSFGPAKSWIADFTAKAGGWRVDAHPRMLVDVNGDGLPDVVGFAEAGVNVALNTGSSFRATERWISDFGANGGWKISDSPRSLVDVNGDGLPDIVGFSSVGIYVSLNSGSSFKSAVRWHAGFGASGASGGWQVSQHPRMLVDVNGDGLPDVVGFANSGVRIALNTGSSFGATETWISDFAADGGWKISDSPRSLVDVNGDGLPDIVGFSSVGIYVSLNSGSSFKSAVRWHAGFGASGASGGWQVSQHPRMLVDVNGDGLPDVVGFAEAGVLVALNSGSSFGPTKSWIADFTVKAGGWRVEAHPRMLVDVNGDGLPDVVGFAEAGVLVALNSGSSFGPTKQWNNYFGAGPSGGGWRVEAHPRGVSSAAVRGKTPTISGKAVVGQSLSVATGVWTPGVSFRYQWLADGSAIKDATSSVLRLTDAMLGKTISVRVTGIKAGLTRLVKTSNATSKVTATVVAGSVKVTGTPAVGDELEAVSSSWTPDAALAYQWLRDGKVIAGATASSYTLTADDAEKKISVKVTGSKAGYASVSKTSAEVLVPIPPKPSPTPTPTPTPTATPTPTPSPTAGPSEEPLLPEVTAPSIGSVKVGSKVSVKLGAWKSSYSVKYQWLLDGKSVKGATKSTYTPLPSDVGKKLGVRVTASASGVESQTVVSKVVKVGKGLPSVKVSAKAGSKGKVTLSIVLGLPGTKDASVVGKVRVYDGARLVKTVTVKKGKASVGLSRLKKGSHTFKVSYGSTKAYEGKSGSVKATIK